MPRLESLRLPRSRALTPQRRPWRWLLLALLAVLVTLVAALPAAWVARTVAARTEGRVVLADAAGTLWLGSATLALSAGAGSQTATVLPGRLQWSVSFWPLLAGTLRMTVSHDEAMPAPVAIAITPAGWQAQAGAMRLPAALLEGVGAPFNTLRPDGAMRLDWTALQGAFRDAPGRPAGLYGHLTVRLDQVSSAVSRLRPLGSYRAEIDWNGRAGALRLSTVAGPLFLEGRGQLGARGRFEGTARAAPEAETQLAALLSLLGRREDNVTRLRF
ncbi:type II secretion system protein N [Cupriavidus sp. AU9028]|uniref:type II secretion system protein N n=1 Tax=Cupriavidus sp. AU9028 TaxID=2871157 RepID=UPI001C970583|nr:type II secretion system protein N [Cupriavidus sp. AU9028]MBY4898997.1 type II secretion system protein N [Cupriavidus sp. AU9028]